MQGTGLANAGPLPASVVEGIAPSPRNGPGVSVAAKISRKGAGMAAILAKANMGNSPGWPATPAFAIRSKPRLKVKFQVLELVEEE